VWVSESSSKAGLQAPQKHTAFILETAPIMEYVLFINNLYKLKIAVDFNSCVALLLEY
jgi:hypothetical protein